MRDTYLREKRREVDRKRSGSAGGPVRKWRFFSIMSFLDPFISARATTGNMAGGVEEALMEEDSLLGDDAAAAAPSGWWRTMK